VSAIDAGPVHAETLRLQEDADRARNWKRWGPYLSERQWGTVREDYSPDGSCWSYFSHDQARSRAYRWGEDGLLGITDRQCRLCFALALWNGRDGILKERLFGLTNPEGNHGEDVKELYYYLDSTPTHSWMKALYKYPQAEFPYATLIEESRRRGTNDPEFELLDTGVFEGGRYFDVFAEYAKASPDDLLVRLRLANRGREAATLHVLPTLWFRNTWSWGGTGEDHGPKPLLALQPDGSLRTEHFSLGSHVFAAAPASDGTKPQMLLTENESNVQRLFGAKNASPFVKDAFHEYVIHGRKDAVNPKHEGTKAAAHYMLVVPAGKEITIDLRLSPEAEAAAYGGPARAFGAAFNRVFEDRRREADAFFAALSPVALTPDEQVVARQGCAGLLWSKQFYHYVVDDWLKGDPNQPPPPESRRRGRNADWSHLFNRDVISMPDKWEYPWYAAWDLAFHMIPMAKLDPEFAKQQLVLFLREWYMHPNGQIPAYEFALSDVNPPVHAWACWRVYKLTGPRGKRDRAFLASCFQKLLLNFTWWVNRKDVEGQHLFSGGFLGLDNIGVFDRGQPLPGGGHLEQADGTAWMAFYCTTMLEMALELAQGDPAYEDLASKFFEHFIHIATAMNTLGGTGLWDEQDGFYYDQIHAMGDHMPLRMRSMVGLIPLYAVLVLEDETLANLPGFRKRLEWFLKYRPDLAKHISYSHGDAVGSQAGPRHLLAVPTRDRLERVLKYLLDEQEFLSPYGVRSITRRLKDQPFSITIGGQTHSVEYVPGESTSNLFGGNSNWRGPIWFPVNYLLVEALERWHYFYGDSFKVQCPAGSGPMMNLKQAAEEIARRLSRIFLPDKNGRRPCHGDERRYAEDPHWRDLVLFYEYFHGESGRGVGASHQTGWTALVVPCLKALHGEAVTMRSSPPKPAPAMALSSGRKR
jgi:hypothetical protein